MRAPAVPTALLQRMWAARSTLRARVTAVAAIGITAAVMLGLLLLYQMQMQTVRTTLDGQLRTYAVQIQESAAAGRFPTPLPQSSLDPGAEAQVIAADGSVISATRTLSGQPAIYALPEGSRMPVRQKAADGVVPSNIRVIALRTSAAGQPVVILAGTDVDLLTQLQSAFARNLVFGLPVILMLSAAVVWLVVGRALRPVEKIRRAVTEITSADLSGRVPEPGTVDEVGNLAHTMNDMLGRLERAAQRQRRFVADASHELRSPLAAIRTTLEVGLAHPTRAPWPVIAERAVTQAARLEELIQQLLLLAKADEHHLAPRQQIVHLATTLEEIRATTRCEGLRLTLRADPDAVIAGDPDTLSRMLRNVIDNAVRYARCAVDVSAQAHPRHIVVEISDDGPGIPPADRERVFDRFVRLDASRDRGSGTSGLGLAIAREIALAHAGNIKIGTGSGGGARVIISLPYGEGHHPSGRSRP